MVFTQHAIFRHVLNMTSTATLGLVALFVVEALNLYYIAQLGEAELAAAIKALAPVAEPEMSDEAKPEDEKYAALSAKVADLEVALAAKGSAPVAVAGAAASDPVEKFKAAAEAKDWKLCASLFAEHKAAILAARNRKTF